MQQYKFRCVNILGWSWRTCKMNPKTPTYLIYLSIYIVNMKDWGSFGAAICRVFAHLRDGLDPGRTACPSPGSPLACMLRSLARFRRHCEPDILACNAIFCRHPGGVRGPRPQLHADAMDGILVCALAHLRGQSGVSGTWGKGAPWPSSKGVCPAWPCPMVVWENKVTRTSADRGHNKGPFQTLFTHEAKNSIRCSGGSQSGILYTTHNDSINLFWLLLLLYLFCDRQG